MIFMRQESCIVRQEPNPEKNDSLLTYFEWYCTMSLTFHECILTKQCNRNIPGQYTMYCMYSTKGAQIPFYCHHPIHPAAYDTPEHSQNSSRDLTINLYASHLMALWHNLEADFSYHKVQNTIHRSCCQLTSPASCHGYQNHCHLFP